MQNRGIRHAAPEAMRKLLAGEAVHPWQVYFVTTPAFETAAPALQWLTRSVFVGTGERQPLTVVMRFWRVGTGSAATKRPHYDSQSADQISGVMFGSTPSSALP